MIVRFALYVFNVYVDVFDGRHDCQGNMFDLGKKSHKSIKGNFMLNKFLHKIIGDILKNVQKNMYVYLNEVV